MTVDRVFRTYFINNRGDEQMGSTWNWQDSYVTDAAPDVKWVEVSNAAEAAFRNQHASTKP